MGTSQTKKMKDRIESLVRARKYKEVRATICKYQIGLAFDSLEQFTVCDWFRRTNQFRDGYNYVTSLGRNSEIPKDPSGTFCQKKLLWEVRFLNLMGASHFAKTLASHIEPADFDEFLILGNLFYSNFESTRSLPLFLKAIEHSPDSTSYQHQLLLITLAENLFDLNEQSKAATLLESVTPFLAAYPTLRAQILQVRGEFEARTELYSSAQRTLKRALDAGQEADKSWDRGFIFKWLGFVEAKLGNFVAAKKHFEQSQSFLFFKNCRIEPYAHLLLLKAQAGLLSPDEFKTLELCRRICPPLFTQLNGDQLPLPKARQVGATDFIYDFSNDEIFEKNQSPRLGISKEDLLLYYLSQATVSGIPQSTLCELIWPDEPHSYLNLHARLEQLVQRLKRRGFKISQKDYRILLNQSVSATALESTYDLPSAFLSRQNSMDIDTFAAFYGISNSNARQRLEALRGQGKLSKALIGKKQTYLPLDRTQDSYRKLHFLGSVG